MLQVGIILHQAKSGRLIVRLSREVKPGAFILDDKGKRLGKVLELIGPVRAPYASVVLSTSRLGKDGDPAYTQG
ncbi:MAG: Gar1/Naf1 family protein [Nitrososphaerales archaeon]|nr:Gar1/Naf1 family protein [Nitrososphaerales archaeon]